MWYVCSCIFFFSSRRRHTRYIGDWSSDVCSSDLLCGMAAGESARGGAGRAVGVLAEAVGRGVAGGGVAGRPRATRGAELSGSTAGVAGEPGGDREAEADEPERRGDVVHDVAGSV